MKKLMKPQRTSKRDFLREVGAYLKDIKNDCKAKERQDLQDDEKTQILQKRKKIYFGATTKTN